MSFFSIFGLDVSRRLSDEIGLFQMNMIVIDRDFASSLSDKYLFSSVSTSVDDLDGWPNVETCLPPWTEVFELLRSLWVIRRTLEFGIASLLIYCNGAWLPERWTRVWMLCT